MTRLTKSKWFLPGFCLLVGFGFLAAQWVGGHPRDGAYSLGLMVVLAVAALLGGRSEVVRGLRGDARDERFRTIDVHAGAFSGFVLVVTLVVLALVELSRGEDISPYGQLLAIAGVAYAGALAFMHVRG